MLIVDGYNWMFATVPGADTGEQPLDRMRNRVVRLLVGWSEMRDEPVLCVFDGTGQRNRQQVGGVEVWFTAGQRTADDDIVERVQRVTPGGAVRVVTADRELADRVRAAGAEVWAPREFQERLAELRRGATRRLEPGDLEKPMAELDVDGMVREFEQADPLAADRDPDPDPDPDA